MQANLKIFLILEKKREDKCILSTFKVESKYFQSNS